MQEPNGQEFKMMIKTFKGARKLLNRFSQDDSGTTAIEYAVIASGISVAIVAAVRGIGSDLDGMYQTVLNAF